MNRIEYQKEWRKANQEKIKAYQKEYRQNHKEERNQKRKLKDRTEESKKYYIKNKEKIKAYRKANKERYDYIRKEYQKKPNRRISNILRSRIRKVLNGISKSQPTMKLLGCDLPTLISHLESQFTEGMNWENYGLYGWHIDHIRPCASFDLTKPEEQAKCFHYTNLQPLWAKDNLSKHDRVLPSLVQNNS